ncbi:MAG: FAD-dependent thymidylate synthase [Thermoprotei archaeon]
MVSVKLVSYTNNGEKLVAVASKQSLSRKPFDYQWQKMSDEEVETWIKETLIRGHLSPWEHSIYTFDIENVSRVLTHQLVRHRLASYTQLSQRYAEMKGEYFNYITPPLIKRDPNIEQIYKDAIEYSRKVYEKLLSLGVQPEDARYVLPQAIVSKIVVTMNARELLNFFGLRLCTKAQWEIRQVAWMMWIEVMKVHPRLFKYAGPRCLLAENQVRKEPIDLKELINSDENKLISERCPELIPKTGIPKCVFFAIKDSGLIEEVKQLLEKN